MSDKATLEIKKFDGKRDLRSEIISFSFDDSSAVSPSMNGSRERKVNKITLWLSDKYADYLAVNWIKDSEKIYPEMIIRGKFSSGKNGTQTRAVFTFNQVKIDGYANSSAVPDEFFFIYKISFEKGSYVLDSTAIVRK